jgi:hypothetical protein
MSFENPIRLQREGVGNINYQDDNSTASTPTPGPTGINKVITFAVGDGQAGSPVDGDTTLHLATLQGQSIYNVQLLVIREGIALNWNSAVQINDIRRYNSGGLGGFTFTTEGGLAFYDGERYMIFIMSINTTTEV